MWTLSLENVVTCLGHTGFVFSVKLLQMKEVYLVSGSDDNSVKIWNISGQCI